MHELSRLSVTDVAECARMMHKSGSRSGSMEECAGRITRYLHERLVDESGRPACALVRFFKTHPFGDLDGELQSYARKLLGGTELDDAVKCLVLLATSGEETAWSSPRLSVEHRAIPLPSPDAVRRLPMIAQLIRQLGLAVGDVVEPNPEILVDLEDRTCRVFHVPEASGSVHIPAQDDFVRPYGIRSVVGFGGVLPSGNLFTMVLFSRTPVSVETASLFEILAVSLKAAVVPFDYGTVFEREETREPRTRPWSARESTPAPPGKPS